MGACTNNLIDFFVITFILVGMKTRNPELTRQIILETAAVEIHRNGFQAASLNNIVDATGLTKGALYHHFPNKLALGYAVVEELIHDRIKELWLRPFEGCKDPIECLQNMIKAKKKQMQVEDVFLGCPLNNLALEMSPIDEGFRLRVSRIYDLWCEGIAEALARGQRNGFVRNEIDPIKTATFIVASIAGCRSMAKNSQSMDVLSACAECLMDYLETLRP